MSSRGILAGLRAASAHSSESSQNNTGRGSESSLRNQQGHESNDAGTTRVVPDYEGQSRSHTEKSLEEVMRDRIVALFKPPDDPRARSLNRRNVGYSASKNGRGDIGLSAEYILGRFKDVGDHYAPLFRQVLRSVAELRSDKRWHLKSSD